MAIFEQRIHLAAPPSAVFAFLSRPENVPLFAPGIDDAILTRGAADLEGAALGLRTRSGRELLAHVTHFHQDESWTVVDERATVAQVQVEADGGGTLLTATLTGNWRPEQEKAVRAEWEHKLHELPRRMDGA